MIKPDMIPKECFVAYQRAFKRGGGVGDALAAALNAWPGADQYLGAVVLPLPQKEKGGLTGRPVASEGGKQWKG